MAALFNHRPPMNSTIMLRDPNTLPMRAIPYFSTSSFQESDAFWYSGHTNFLNASKIAMYERAAELPLLLTTWVLFADARRAQLYERRYILGQEYVNGHPYGDRQSKCVFVPVKDGTIEAKMTDDRPSPHNPQAPIHYTTHTRHFMKSIADKLQQSFAHKLFDKLVVVSPAQLIAELKEHLSDNVKNSIVGIPPKDFRQYQS